MRERVGASNLDRIAEAIRLDRITKYFLTPSGARHTVVENMTLDVSDGKFLSVVAERMR